MIGQKVFLDAMDIHTTRPTKKFAHCFLSPYPVVRPVGSHAYRLKLPPPPIYVTNSPGGKERYKIEEVINSCIYRGRLQYLVRWKGYGHEENLWLAEGDINAPELIMEFYRAHTNAPKCISTLAFRQLGF